MSVGIIGKLIPSFRSLVGHDDDQLCNIHHFAPPDPTQLEGGADGENVISTDHVVRFQFWNLSSGRQLHHSREQESDWTDKQLSQFNPLNDVSQIGQTNN